jgi:Ca-activated chloride channel family protein
VREAAVRGKDLDSLLFHQPAWLFLSVLAILPWLQYRARPRLRWPTLDGFRHVRQFPVSLLPLVSPLLRSIAIVSIVLALAGPRTVLGRTKIAGKGVSILAAVDRSLSMTTPDFSGPDGLQWTRLEAARHTFARFIEQRPGDLIGLEIFADFADIACPPTLDHESLLAALAEVEPAPAGEQSTNLGDAIVWGLDPLRKSPTRKRVLILLTDGVNSPGVPRPTPPLEAAQFAKEFDVVIHTIALGSPGGIHRTTETVTKLGIVSEAEGPDLELLRRIAEVGGGRAFVARDGSELAGVFAAIDALEKDPIEGTIRTRYQLWYPTILAVAIACLVLDRLLVSGPLRMLS